MKIIGLIQARMGSSRLPGKVMSDLAGRPLVWHILDRLRRVDELEDFVLATTVAPENDILAEWAENEGMKVVRHIGEDDIVGRLVKALDVSNCDAMLKTNADCPFLDPGIATRAIRCFKSAPHADGVTNKIRRTYPLGLSLELVGQQTLRWCDANLTAPKDRELVVKWIFDHPERFNVLSIEADEDCSHFDLTVDTIEDYNFARDIFDALYKKNECFGWNDIRNYLSSCSEIPECAYLELSKAS